MKRNVRLPEVKLEKGQYIVSRIPDESLSYFNYVYVYDKNLDNKVLKLVYKNNEIILKSKLFIDDKRNEISIGVINRKYLKCDIDSIINIIEISDIINIKTIKFSISKLKKRRNVINTYLDNDDIITYIRDNFMNTVFNIGQTIIYLQLKTKEHWILQIKEFNSDETVGLITNDTEIYVDGDEIRNEEILKIDDVSFEKLGVGGVDKQFEELFRRAFMTRVISKKTYKKLGIQHTKGILLYGPSGTGKTRLARSLSNILKCKSIKIVSGPELLNKYVGQSEENVRKLFEEAMNDKDPNNLYMIVFDEFDSLCKSRGSSQSGIGDSIVNQLLSQIDGVNVMNNIVLVGLTNRKDMIDEAILREGRFSVHIEIGLPDDIGRLQILKLHTQTLVDNKVLDDSVNLELYAHNTENFTGAEIEGLVKDAISRALREKIELDKISDTVKNTENIIVTDFHFKLALQNIKPMFGKVSDKIDKILMDSELDILWNTDVYNNIYSELLEFKTSDKCGMYSVLLHGDSGSGKTFLSALLARNLQFKFTKYISANELIMFSDIDKVTKLLKLIDDAQKSQESLIIIDDLDIIMEWTPHTFSNKVVQSLKTILGTIVRESKLIVIINCVNYTQLNSLQMFDRVKTKVNIDKNK